MASSLGSKDNLINHNFKFRHLIKLFHLTRADYQLSEVNVSETKVDD